MTSFTLRVGGGGRPLLPLDLRFPRTESDDPIRKNDPNANTRRSWLPGRFRSAGMLLGRTFATLPAPLSEGGQAVSWVCHVEWLFLAPRLKRTSWRTKSKRRSQSSALCPRSTNVCRTSLAARSSKARIAGTRSTSAIKPTRCRVPSISKSRASWLPLSD